MIIEVNAKPKNDNDPCGLVCYGTPITINQEFQVLQAIWRRTDVGGAITLLELSGVIKRAGWVNDRGHYSAQRAVDAILKRARKKGFVQPAPKKAGWIWIGK
jgi:hypothetical protein